MRVRMKLTTLCDKDLLTLNNISGFDFRGWIRDVLGTYASTGDICKTLLPAAPPDKPVLKNIMFSINFDETRDAAVVELLNAVQNRLRSGVIKSILRSSLDRPCLYAYFNSYPAPFPVTRPEISEPAERPVEHTASLPVSLPTIPKEQAPAGASDRFNIYDFDDEIK